MALVSHFAPVPGHCIAAEVADSLNRTYKIICWYFRPGTLATTWEQICAALPPGWITDDTTFTGDMNADLSGTHNRDGKQAWVSGNWGSAASGQAYLLPPSQQAHN